MIVCLQTFAHAKNPEVHAPAGAPDDHQQGYAAACTVVRALAQTGESERATLVADAIGDLIDLDLGWDRMEPTLARLRGFAAGLVPLLCVEALAPSRAPDGAAAANAPRVLGQGGQL